MKSPSGDSLLEKSVLGNRGMLQKMAAGAVRYRLTGHRLPLHVYLSVTHRCNVLCTHCSVPLQNVDELRTEEWIALIDHLAQNGTVRVTLGGGEPLLRPDIAVLVERLAAHGIWTTLETNGYRLPEVLPRLSRLRQVVLPVDGTEAHHDALREPGSYAKVLRALSAARAAEMPVWTMTVLDVDTVNDVEAVLDLVDRYEATANFQVLEASDSPYGHAAERRRAPPAAIKKALRTILEARRAGRRVGTSEKTLRYLIGWDDYRASRKTPPQEDLHCVAGQLYCAVDADGTVLPCPKWSGAFSGKSTRVGGFDAGFEALRDNTCKACTSTALTEINYLYNLNLPTVFEWMKAGRWYPGVPLPRMASASATASPSTAPSSTAPSSTAPPSTPSSSTLDAA